MGSWRGILLGGLSQGALSLAQHSEKIMEARKAIVADVGGVTFRPKSKPGSRKRAGHRLRPGKGVRAMPSGCTSTLRKAMREERRLSLARSVA